MSNVMSNSRVLSMIRAALAIVFVVVGASRAAAGPLILSDVQVDLDPVGLIATITAQLQADPLAGSDVYLDALSVDLSQDGQQIADLFAGPTLLNADPFFNLPLSLAPGEILQSGTVLFQLTGLVANATYAGTFALFQFDWADGSATTLASEAFSFSTAPVPEPASLLLLASGLGAGLVERRRRRRGRG
jgi:hypothetical protein